MSPGKSLDLSRLPMELRSKFALNEKQRKHSMIEAKEYSKNLYGCTCSLDLDRVHSDSCPMNE